MQFGQVMFDKLLNCIYMYWRLKNFYTKKSKFLHVPLKMYSINKWYENDIVALPERLKLHFKAFQVVENGQYN